MSVPLLTHDSLVITHTGNISSEILKRFYNTIWMVISVIATGITPDEYISMPVVPRNISSRFSSDSEAFATELVESFEELFPRYW